jgi:hypothetical protein
VKRYDPTAGRFAPITPLLPAVGTAPAAAKGQATSEQASADSVGAVIAGGTQDGILAVYNTILRALDLTNTDKGSVARAAHEAASDPHPQYLQKAGGTVTGTLTLDASNLELQVNDSSPLVRLWSASDTTSFIPLAYTRRSGGTITVPTNVKASMNLGGFAAQGWDGSAWSTRKAAVEFAATADWTPTSTPAEIRFFTTDTTGGVQQRMRVDSGGRLVIGTGAARDIDGALGGLHMEGADVQNSRFGVVRNSADNAGARISIGKSRGTSPGSVAAALSGDFLGSLIFAAADGTDLRRGAAIFSQALENFSAAANGSDLSFQTVTAGTMTAATRLTLNGTAATFSVPVRHGAGTAALPSVTGGTASTGVWFPSTSAVAFSTLGTEAFRVDTGNFYLGTTGNLPAVGPVRFHAYGTGFSSSSSAFSRYSADADGSYFVFLKSRGASLGTNTTVAVSDVLGRFQWRGTDGTTSVGGAELVAIVDSAPASGVVPTSLRLRTMNSAGTIADRVTITSGGLVGIGGSPTASLDVNGGTVRLRTARTPASATAVGNQGDICWDANYLYVCVATNTWRRVAHATW